MSAKVRDKRLINRDCGAREWPAGNGVSRVSLSLSLSDNRKQKYKESRNGQRGHKQAGTEVHKRVRSGYRTTISTKSKNVSQSHGERNKQCKQTLFLVSCSSDDDDARLDSLTRSRQRSTDEVSKVRRSLYGREWNRRENCRTAGYLIEWLNL